MVTHLPKCRCLAPLNFAEQGERTLSVGLVIPLFSQLLACSR